MWDPMHSKKDLGERRFENTKEDNESRQHVGNAFSNIIPYLEDK